MISNEFLRMMSRYNRWQNGWLFDAAGKLSEADRQKDRAGFWGGIQTTLCHLYWGDQIWFSRFDLIDPPGVAIQQSGTFLQDWAVLAEKRNLLDDMVVRWSDEFADGPIEGTLKWFSGAVNKEMEAPLSVILPHIFNHQTHHRGQVHGMLTDAGVATEDTDLFLMPDAYWQMD